MYNGFISFRTFPGENNEKTDDWGRFMSQTATQNRITATIRAMDLVEYPLCPTTIDADKLFLAIQEQFHNGHNVILSFEGIDWILPPIFSCAIGPLLLEYTEEEIRSRLQVIDVSEDDLRNVDRAFRNMKAYYQDPEKHDKAFERGLRVFKDL